MSLKLNTPVFLSYAFRPFFLLNGLFAIAVVLAWLMILRGVGVPGLGVWWHAHEMLLGFAMAAVAGFSLTAVATWTGRPAVHGMELAVLVVCWLAGRAAMAFSHWLPPMVVATLDMMFPLLLVVLLGREIIAGRSHRNYPLVALLAVMAVLNGLYHLGFNGIVPDGERIALYLLIHAMLLLVTLISGRIIPAFTANWMRKQGRQNLPQVDIGLDKLALAITLVAGLAITLAPAQPQTAILAFAAALVHGFRLSRWRGLATMSNPLIFVLHAAYAWLPLGYILAACAVFGWGITATAALHALTMGAIGTMVLAVTTRVALGHTGRALQAAGATVFAYWILAIAVLFRVVGTLFSNSAWLMIDAAAIGWALAFAIFTWVYWPILTGPPKDGQS